LVIKHISCKSFANNLKIRCKFCPLKFQQGSKAEEQKGVRLGEFKNRNQTRVCSDQMRALYPLRYSANVQIDSNILSYMQNFIATTKVLYKNICPFCQVVAIFVL